MFHEVNLSKFVIEGVLTCAECFVLKGNSSAKRREPAGRFSYIRSILACAPDPAMAPYIPLAFLSWNGLEKGSGRNSLYFHPAAPAEFHSTQQKTTHDRVREKRHVWNQVCLIWHRFEPFPTDFFASCLSWSDQLTWHERTYQTTQHTSICNMIYKYY